MLCSLPPPFPSLKKNNQNLLICTRNDKLYNKSMTPPPLWDQEILASPPKPLVLLWLWLKEPLSPVEPGHEPLHLGCVDPLLRGATTQPKQQASQNKKHVSQVIRAGEKVQTLIVNVKNGLSEPASLVWADEQPSPPALLSASVSLLPGSHIYLSYGDQKNVPCKNITSVKM